MLIFRGIYKYTNQIECSGNGETPPNFSILSDLIRHANAPILIRVFLGGSRDKWNRSTVAVKRIFWGQLCVLQNEILGKFA